MFDIANPKTASQPPGPMRCDAASELGVGDDTALPFTELEGTVPVLEVVIANVVVLPAEVEVASELSTKDEAVFVKFCATEGSGWKEEHFRSASVEQFVCAV
jgi:hypothetical protein